MMVGMQPGALLWVGGILRSAAGQLSQERLLGPFPHLPGARKVGACLALMFLRLGEPGLSARPALEDAPWTSGARI